MPLPVPITSRSNARVKALRATFTGRASRPGELTAVEGEILLSEVRQAGLRLETLFIRQTEAPLLQRDDLRALQPKETLVLSDDVFASVVETATPQGIAGTLAIPSLQRASAEAPGPVLLLENVQDPGNVGTLIRSAAAFGAAEVLLVGECANPWSPKVLRASAGAVFRLPVLKVALKEGLTPGRRVFAAVPHSDGAMLSSATDLCRAVLLVGNEGRGLTEEALALADELLSIPCRIESLNAAVAGSLLLYEAYRQAGDSSR